MGVFVSRESEAIIPNIFFFLVLLSYERYHSKQIIGIPKIIQLCDGIMASGRKAVTHGNGIHVCLLSLVLPLPTFNLTTALHCMCCLCTSMGAHACMHIG